MNALCVIASGAWRHLMQSQPELFQDEIASSLWLFAMTAR